MSQSRKSRRNADFDRDEFAPAKPGKGPQKNRPTKLRIVSGDMGGRKISYNGDPATRPMKQRTREAVFSLLGGKLPGTFAIDMFAGTGILAMESISRGSASGVALELARPAVRTIVGNLKDLNLGDRLQVQNVDTLRWLRHLDLQLVNFPDVPWIVFCCPPYKLWINEGEKLCEGLAELYDSSPSGSQFVCETEKYDICEQLPQIEWDVREYHPATISIAKKP